MANDLLPWQRYLMTPHNTLGYVDDFIVTKPVKFWAVWSIFTEVMRTMFHGEHCVAMASAFEEISKLSRRCLHGWTVGTHVNFLHFLTVFIGVIAISCFIERDALPWQRLLRKIH